MNSYFGISVCASAKQDPWDCSRMWAELWLYANMAYDWFRNGHQI